MQTAANNNDREKESLEAPARLVTALQQATKQDLFIPRTLDEKILKEAHGHLSIPPQKPCFDWRALFRWSFAIGTVLIIAVAVGALWYPIKSEPNHTTTTRVNKFQSVDILDAFALARELKAGKHPDPRQDVNGDGVIDERDVTALAARAVSLQKGGRS